MLSAEAFDAIDARLLELESKLSGISPHFSVREQLQSQLDRFKPILEHNVEIGKLFRNLKNIGIYDELPIDLTQPDSGVGNDDDLTLEDKRLLVEMNIPKLESYLNTFDELLRHLDSLNELDNNYAKRIELCKLSSISDEQLNHILDQYSVLKNNYNKLIIRSIKCLEMNLILVYEQNKFYSTIEDKLQSLERKVNQKLNSSTANNEDLIPS